MMQNRYRMMQSGMASQDGDGQQNGSDNKRGSETAHAVATAAEGRWTPRKCRGGRDAAADEAGPSRRKQTTNATGNGRGGQRSGYEAFFVRSERATNEPQIQRMTEVRVTIAV